MQILLHIDYSVIPRGKVASKTIDSMLYDIICKAEHSTISYQSTIDLYIPEQRIDYYSPPRPFYNHFLFNNSLKMTFYPGDSIKSIGTFIDLRNHAKLKYITDDGEIAHVSLDTIIPLYTFIEDMKIHGVRR